MNPLRPFVTAAVTIVLADKERGMPRGKTGGQWTCARRGGAGSGKQGRVGRGGGHEKAGAPRAARALLGLHSLATVGALGPEGPTKTAAFPAVRIGTGSIG